MSGLMQEPKPGRQGQIETMLLTNIWKTRGIECACRAGSEESRGGTAIFPFVQESIYWVSLGVVPDSPIHKVNWINHWEAFLLWVKAKESCKLQSHWGRFDLSYRRRFKWKCVHHQRYSFLTVCAVHGNGKSGINTVKRCTSWDALCSTDHSVSRQLLVFYCNRTSNFILLLTDFFFGRYLIIFVIV